MAKNLQSKNLNHSTRNDDIYHAIKASKPGLTRQELVKCFDGLYGMEQVCSGVGALLDSSTIFYIGQRTNAETDQTNEVFSTDSHLALPRRSKRKDEMAALKLQVEALTNELQASRKAYRTAVDSFKAFYLKLKKQSLPN